MLELDVQKRQGAFTLDTVFRSDGPGVTALFGRSGAGKTSVINMVAGLATPDRGRIIVKGRPLFDSERGINLAPEKRRIGYVFQDGRLFPHLSVRANLTYGMGLTPAGERYTALDQVVALLGIGHLLSRRPARLSGGEKQRVAIGRALLTSPSLLLMDEPLASLDAARKAEVLPFVARLARELSVPILYVSHSLDEILNLADTLVLMDGGRAVAVGPIDQLMARPDLQLLADHPENSGAVLSARVERHDSTASLTCLQFAGGMLKVPRMDLPPDSPVRVRIPARNVAISLSRPPHISVQNVFAGTVQSVGNAPGAFVDVDLDIGCPLPARITRFAAVELGLKPGLGVFALVKCGAVSGGHLLDAGEG